MNELNVKLLYSKMRVKNAMNKTKASIHNFLTSEKGGSEIIATIIIIGIVLVIGVAFGDQISAFVKDLWDKLIGNAKDYDKPDAPFTVTP